MGMLSLNLAKQNFKFSVAHFLIFDEKNAERLHGHNYQVRIDLSCVKTKETDERGYVVDFTVIKKIVKAQCEKWDEYVLLPEKNPDFKYSINSKTKNYEIHFRDRFYSFPKNETIWLPIRNTSVENLSELFAQSIAKDIFSLPVVKFRITIEETRGQSASFTMKSPHL